MAKSRARSVGRKVPTTPVAGSEDPEGVDAPPQPVRLAHRYSGGNSIEIGDPIAEAQERWPGEPLYLITGTGCIAGHEPGSELIGGKLGKVPSQKTTRIGVGLIIWLLLGIVFLTNLLWLALSLLGGTAWIIMSAVVQRRSGHRGHCWRTRLWRYAWGGLVPMPRMEDPTREAE
jgi:hypothetical protein